VADALGQGVSVGDSDRDREGQSRPTT